MEGHALGAYRRRRLSYRVEGINLMDNGEPFYWRVPNISDPAYDLSGVAVPELTETPAPLDPHV